MSATNYRSDLDALHDRIQKRVKARAESDAAAIAAGECCPKCLYYKRGIDGRCVQCFALWPLPPQRTP